jgi:hypothetical protein
MTPTVPFAAGLLAMAAPTDQAVSPWVQLVPFALVLGIFYFVILLPMKRRQKKIQEVAALKVGDKSSPPRHLRLGHEDLRPSHSTPDSAQRPRGRVAGGHRRLPGAGPGGRSERMSHE